MDLTASQITQEALMILKARNCQVWRQNNLTVRKRKGIVTKGVSDIIGYNKGTAEWMGWENVFHCEWNEFGQKILKHYWPGADLLCDITKNRLYKVLQTELMFLPEDSPASHTARRKTARKRR
jgi:hypothetical protein